MKLKHLSYIIVSFVLFSCGEQKAKDEHNKTEDNTAINEDLKDSLYEQNQRIEGDFIIACNNAENLKGMTVELERRQGRQMQVVSSAVVNDEGKLKISGNTNSQEIFRLNVNGEFTIPFVAQKGDSIGLTIGESNQDYNFENSEQSKLLKEYVSMIGKIGPISNFQKKESVGQMKSFIEKSMPSYVGLVAMEDFMAIYKEKADLPFIEAMIKRFGDEDDYARKFIGEFDDYKNKLVAQKENQQNRTKIEIGAKAPDFQLPDVNGKNVSLSDFKGKYVLVDFWASWCGPCRRENPNVVKAYKKYHDAGFEVLGVSLDKNKDKWIRAIQKDRLTWTHVSDLSYWNSKVVGLYGINGIPYTLLLDKTGTIIGMNLRGRKLEAKLAEVIKL